MPYPELQEMNIQEAAQHLLCGVREGCMEKRTTAMNLEREVGGGGAGGGVGVRAVVQRETEFRNQKEMMKAVESPGWLNAC